MSRANVRAVCGLGLAEGQQRLVAPAAFTVAEGFWRRCAFEATGRTLDGEPLLARVL